MLIINPGFACGPSSTEDNFEFGEPEMIKAVEGTWRVTFARPEGPGVVTFSLEKGPAPTSPALTPPSGITPQCTSRSFLRPAAACSPMSSLALAAKVVEAEPPIEATEGVGVFRVSGVRYIGGHVEIRFGTALVLTANLDASNAVASSFVQWQGTTVESVFARAEP